MATEAQKDKFIEALKFTPIEVTVRMWGYGGEMVLGNVSKESYEYFRDNEIDLDEFACDWDNESEVPENLQPFNPGNWHECDNITHEYGVEMSESCHISVEDENGKIIWQHNLDPSDLEETGTEVSCIDEYYATNSAGPVFMGQSTEKGTFFEGTFTLRAPFNPTKLSLSYCDIEGWELCSNVTYDNEDIDNTGGDTTGKGLWFKFLNTGEEE